jgi:hypothetical protein
VQAVYAHHISQPDRLAQVIGTIRSAAATVDNTFDASARETGGDRHVRWVTDGSCLLSVMDVAFSNTATDFYSEISEFYALGLNSPTRKYLIWMDTDHVFCGIANLSRDSQPGPANVANRGPDFGLVDSSCWGGFAEAHELMHTLGAVEADAPHVTAGSHCTDEWDVMCYQDAPDVVLTYPCPQTHASLFDCNHDDYFSTQPAPGGWLSSHWNTANSSFLEIVPAPPPPLPVGDGPGATTAGQGAEDVYVRGTDDALWTRHLNNGTWGLWTTLGGVLTSAPAASGIDVYVRGTDNAIWTRHGSGGWLSLGGVLTSAPAATPTDLYARGTDNALWTRHLNNGSWGPWTTLGGVVTSAPAASDVDVFVRGTDNGLWTRHGSGGWLSLGGILTTGPGVGGGNIFARGTDNGLWTRTLSTGWVSLGGFVTSPPAATDVDVFVRGTDNALWTRTLSTDWVSLGGLLK